MLVNFDMGKNTFTNTCCRDVLRVYVFRPDQRKPGPGEPHPDRCLRFDPKTVLFTEYVLPGRCGIDGETWIDNSTDAVTVCYVDDEGWLVRVQPRDVR